MISGYSAYDSSSVPSLVTKLLAIDGNAADFYGYSVSVGSERIVVGSPGNDDGGSSSGSAYIYNLEGDSVVDITAFDASLGDEYGHSVAVGCGRIIVGAPQVGSAEGAAYLYDVDGNLITKLVPFDGDDDFLYGWSVAVGSGRIVIGARGAENSGAAYVYDLNGNFLQKLTAFDKSGLDNYGYSVSVGSGRIVIGSPFDDDNSLSSSGSVYIYSLDGILIQKITASIPQAGSAFGSSVAVNSGRIVVGVPYDNDGAKEDSGSAYVYDLNGNEITKLTAFDSAADDQFGFSVSIGSGRIAIGAHLDGSGAGSVYLYDLNGNYITKLTSVDPAPNDAFGFSVSIGSGRIVVGVFEDDDLGVNSGSGYIYETKKQVHMLDLIDEIYPY
jgi:hypothetical protein